MASTRPTSRAMRSRLATNSIPAHGALARPPVLLDDAVVMLNYYACVPDPPSSDKAIVRRDEASGSLEHLCVELDKARQEVLQQQKAILDWASGIGAHQSIDDLAQTARDWLRLQVVSINYQDALIRCKSALDDQRQNDAREWDRRAEERSSTETRAIRRATFWMMIFTALIAVATVVGVLVAIFKRG